MREFNTTGLCVPEMHYMVNTEEKLEKIIQLIDKKKYFTINRSRQYGKTTTMYLLKQRLKKRYEIISISFEGIGEEPFASNINFVKTFIDLCADSFRFTRIEEADRKIWSDISVIDEEKPFRWLSKKITALCEKYQIILTIDEMDKCSDNQVFLNFLGMLREKYLSRVIGEDFTFQSVILAGVYDIKNLKLKLRPDEEKKYNSPWNIAEDFDVDMSFSPKEIATMLSEYEADYHTGMNIDDISKEIYFYTNGYPYLVSWICKWIDEQGDKTWSKDNVKKAEKMIHLSDSILLDDLSKNYYNNQELRQMIVHMLFEGKKFAYSKNDSVIKLGSLLGILINKNGEVSISNVIFENALMELVVMEKARQNVIRTFPKNQFIKDGKLDMPHILTKFQEIMKAEYRSEDEKFLEKQGRLLFICFLKPIINGTGFYYVEPETRDNTKMDIVVTYGIEEHIIELKIWHGEQYRKEGIEQLENYLENRNQHKGYLVSFSFNKNKEYVNRWLAADETEKDIFEVVL